MTWLSLPLSIYDMAQVLTKELTKYPVPDEDNDSDSFAAIPGATIHLTLVQLNGYVNLLVPEVRRAYRTHLKGRPYSYRGIPIQVVA